MGHIYILCTVFLTVYGQLAIKWQVNNAGVMPVGTGEKVFFILSLVCNPIILSGLAAAFIASLFWIAAMTKFDLSYAYPFTSLSFILVLVLTSVFFQEPINLAKLVGTGFIIFGIVICAQG